MDEKIEIHDKIHNKISAVYNSPIKISLRNI